MSKKFNLKECSWGRFWFIIALLFAVLFAILLGALYLRHKIETTNTVNTVVATPHHATVSSAQLVKDLKEREALANEHLTALRWVVEKTNDPQAHEIFNALGKYGAIVVPGERGILIPSGIDDNGSIRIIPLLPSDDFFTEKSSADFVPTYRAIILKNNALISAVFQGIFFIHEGNHALIYWKHPYVTRSNKVQCEEERDTHEFVNRLLLKIGGAGYEQLLLKEINAMPVKLYDDGPVFPPPGKYRVELDKIFGTALSDSEKDARQTMLWIDTVFHSIDGHYGGDKEEVKAEFLCKVYIDQGILQKE